MRRKNQMTKVTLCGSPGCKCPVADFTDAGLIITDDYGGRVQLTAEEAKQLAKSIQDNQV